MLNIRSRSASITAQKASSGPNRGMSLVLLDNVDKTFETSAGPITVLRGVDLRVEPGEFVGITGRSGSGKSTLINVLTGIDRPTSGQVQVCGADLSSLSENQLGMWRGKNVGLVFQFFQLLPTLSILDNVMLPMDFAGLHPSGERPAIAMALLEQVGLAEHAHKLPSALSGGQQQRAAIARALANDPPFLVADEPTGNLDTATAEQIFALFERLAGEGKTILMVTHADELALRTGRHIVLSDGRIVGDSPHGRTNGSVLFAGAGATHD